jgi:pyruvate/2-oxoglutarate dehydrogenase complex dihydrolipoamide acyltransferase (E2) component
MSWREIVVRMPKLTDVGDSAIIVEWLVEPGSVLNEGDPLVVVDTAKVQSEIACPASGRVTELLVAEEEEVETGQVIALLAPSDQDSGS